MSKLLNSVLEKVSENNNEYRTNLRSLNSDIDERTTTLVGDLVTSSGYILDFSKTLETAKENLVNPISRIVESYVIRDLRSVESVNEQFIEKINDKIENTAITSPEEKENFVNNLETLLNEKYTEIVNIKRIPFFEDGKNDEIEEKISSFVSVIKNEAEFDATFNEIIDAYKSNLYTILNKTLNDISKLYQDNFINEVESNMNIDVDVEEKEKEEIKEDTYEPTISNVPEIPSFGEERSEEVNKEETNDNTFNAVIPEIPALLQEEFNNEPVSEVPEMPVVSEDITNDVITADIPEIPNFITEDKIEDGFIEENIENNKEEIEEVKPLDTEPIKPIELSDDKDGSKRSYDIDEILKIAKSPILDMPESKNEKGFVNVEPISFKKEETIDSEYDEGEIVGEMINRLKARLDAINKRKNAILEEREKIEEDEVFVNDLIESSRRKKEELDKFELELDEKSKELDQKQEDLEEKIKSVMPFANALLNQEES